MCRSCPVSHLPPCRPCQVRSVRPDCLSLHLPVPFREQSRLGTSSTASSTLGVRGHLAVVENAAWAEAVGERAHPKYRAGLLDCALGTERVERAVRNRRASPGRALLPRGERWARALGHCVGAGLCAPSSSSSSNGSVIGRVQRPSHLDLDGPQVYAARAGEQQGGTQS